MYGWYSESGRAYLDAISRYHWRAFLLSFPVLLILPCNILSARVDWFPMRHSIIKWHVQHGITCHVQRTAYLFGSCSTHHSTAEMKWWKDRWPRANRYMGKCGMARVSYIWSNHRHILDDSINVNHMVKNATKRTCFGRLRRHDVDDG